MKSDRKCQNSRHYLDGSQSLEEDRFPLANPRSLQFVNGKNFRKLIRRCRGNDFMTDHVSSRRRSEIMRNIKAKDTSPEILVRSLLHRMGYRFRLHVKTLPGHPDIVLPCRRKIIFVHGCFWHAHKNCKKATLPKSNVAFWEAKILRNKARDTATRRLLKRAGWELLTIWQCQLKDLGDSDSRCAIFWNGKLLTSSPQTVPEANSDADH